MRVYLSGAMDKAVDLGIGWRDMITPTLKKLGIVVLNPCDKPIDMEFKIENRQYRQALKTSCKFDELNSEVRKLRVVDLRLVDVSDFLIVYLDNDVSSCGTWEEICTANRQKKPVLIMCKQGKVAIPDWVWGMLPHQHIFSDWDGVFSYLVHIHCEENVDSLKRWIFFDYSKMLPERSVEESALEASIMLNPGGVVKESSRACVSPMSKSTD
jgi:nucleoside 2-deoxyribosyltransferase